MQKRQILFETEERIKEADTDYLKKRGVMRLGHREIFTAKKEGDGIEICGGTATKYYFDDKEPEELPFSQACIFIPRLFLDELIKEFNPSIKEGMDKERL
jgi:hypothetical protein